LTQPVNTHVQKRKVVTVFEIKGNPRKGLFGATLGFFVGFASIALFGSTANMFQEAMHIDPLLVGLLVAAPSLSGSLLRIPFAAWVDTTGGRKPFLILLILSIVGMSGLFLVVHFFYAEQMNNNLYPILLFLGVLSGCGIATFSVGISQVSYWFPQKNQGLALGIYAGVGNLAPGIFSILLPLFLLSIGLSGSYLIWLIFLVIGTCLYKKLGLNAWYFQLNQNGWTKDESRKIASERYGQEVFPKGTLTSSLLLSARQWKTWALVAIYFTSFGGFIALTAWLPTYWKTFYSLSLVKAGALTAVFSILASLIRIVGGKFSDRWGGENTALGALMIIFVGALLMSFSHSLLLSLSATIIIAVGMGVTNAAVFKLVPQEVPDAVGGASGWVGGLGAFGGFVIPPFMGIISQNNGSMGHAHGFFIFAGLALVSLAFSFLLRRTRQKRGIVINQIIKTETVTLME